MMFSLFTCLAVQVALTVSAQANDNIANSTTYQGGLFSSRSLRGSMSTSDEHRRLNILAWSTAATRGTLEEGDACDKHVQCKLNHFCKGRVCRRQETGSGECNGNGGNAFCESWNCVDYRTLGYADHLFTAGTKLCSDEPKNHDNNKARGDTCSNDPQCNQEHDYCGQNGGGQNVCLEREDLDSTCTKDEACKSNRCLSGVCVDPSLYPTESRLACEFDTDCVSGECASDNKCACAGAPKAGEKYFIREHGSTDKYLFMHDGDDKKGPSHRLGVRIKQNKKPWKFIASNSGKNAHGTPTMQFRNQEQSSKYIGSVAYSGAYTAAGQNVDSVTTKWVIEAADGCEGFYFKFFGDYLYVTSTDWGGKHGSNDKIIHRTRPDKTAFDFDYISTVV